VPCEAERLLSELIVPKELWQRLTKKPDQNVPLAQIGVRKAYSKGQYGSDKNHE